MEGSMTTSQCVRSIIIASSFYTWLEMVRKKADLHPPLPEGEETGLCADGLDVCSREVVLKLQKNNNETIWKTRSLKEKFDQKASIN